ncbi:MAG: hypothetical protein QXM31_00110 [Candidatus Woesearchaeota archaeon]
MRLTAFFLVLVLAGCAAAPGEVQQTSQCRWPEIPKDSGCCRDLNGNGICDTIDLAAEIEAEKQREYEEAAQKARETAEISGKYKPTIVNLLYANATGLKGYRFLYKGDEVVVANGSIIRKLVNEYQLGDREINGRRVNVVVNTVYLDFVGRAASAECVPPEALAKQQVGTVCDKFLGARFPVKFDVFAFKMPAKWLEDLLYRNPVTILPGSHIGKRPATLYKFTDLQDANRKTHIWIDDLAGMPLRVEVWQGGLLVEEEDYLDFYPI